MYRFDHIGLETKNLCLRHIIDNINKYKYESLASIWTSMVRVDMDHKIVLDIISQQLINRFRNRELLEISHTIKSVDIAQFFTAFTHFEWFDDTVLTALQQIFVKSIEDAPASSTAALLISHTNWVRESLKLNSELNRDVGRNTQERYKYRRK